MAFEVIRTPEARFEGLKDYPFEPHFMTCLGYRIHFVDEGKEGDPIVLLLHGEPSWSYLYRKMIPLLVEAGFRVLAPDLLGFGKSDKLVNQGDYSYQLLVDIFTDFVEQLEQRIAVMFVQDWGSLIGLRLLGTVGDQIDRVLLSNGGLPAASGWKGWIGHLLFRLKIWRTGTVTREQLNENPGFVTWVAYSQTVDHFPVAGIIQGASVTKLDEGELEAYNAPFPDESYKAGARKLPMLVTSQLRKNYQVWDNVLTSWDKPFLTIFGENDPITKGNEQQFIDQVPGAQGLEHLMLKKAGHFIQEDQPQELTNRIAYLFKKPLP